MSSNNMQQQNIGFVVPPAAPVAGGGGGSQPSSRVEVSLAARSLADTDVFSKSDPICVMDEWRPAPARRGGLPGQQMQWVEVGRTEVIDNNLNPEWTRKLQLDYFFERAQKLRFRVYDVDNEGAVEEQDKLGWADCELADVVAAPNGLLVVTLNLSLTRGAPRGTGQLHIHAEELKGAAEQLHAVIHGHDLDVHTGFLGITGDSKRPFLEFFRVMPDGSRQMVHRTETSQSKSPEWRRLVVPVRLLCPPDDAKGVPDKNAEFVVEVKDFRNNGDHRLVGTGRTSLNKLLSGQSTQQRVVIPLQKPNGKEGSAGELRFLQFEVQTDYSFLDYIASGLQLEFAVAIDFTASNGPVHEPHSLHYFGRGYPNQYEMATRSVLEIIEHYNRSKQFEATGFGAVVALPPMGQPGYSDMFPLRLNDFTTTVVGVNGVMEAYRIALERSQLHGPTNFSPTINFYAERTRQFPRDGSRYQVLLIITDGQITDMEKTKLAVIMGSDQPLSIIIVGVGRADFDRMDQLDSDQRLLSAGGRTAKRDIVQFVPFRDHLEAAAVDSTNLTTEQRDYVQRRLANEVLAELPAQVTGWMKARGIRPTQTLGGGAGHHGVVATSPPLYPPAAPPAGGFDWAVNGRQK